MGRTRKPAPRSVPPRSRWSQRCRSWPGSGCRPHPWPASAVADEPGPSPAAARRAPVRRPVRPRTSRPVRLRTMWRTTHRPRPAPRHPRCGTHAVVARDHHAAGAGAHHGGTACAVLCPSPTAFVAEHGRFQITGSVQGLAAGSGVVDPRRGTHRRHDPHPGGRCRGRTLRVVGPGWPLGQPHVLRHDQPQLGRLTGGSVGGGAATGALVAHVAPLAVSVTSGLAPRSYTPPILLPLAASRPGSPAWMVWTEALLQGCWTRISTATTGAGGAYSIPLAWGAGKLNAVSYRVGYTRANHPRTVYGPQIRLTRFPELRATVRAAKLPPTCRCPTAPAVRSARRSSRDRPQLRGLRRQPAPRFHRAQHSRVKFIDVFTKALNSRPDAGHAGPERVR